MFCVRSSLYLYFVSLCLFMLHHVVSFIYDTGCVHPMVTVTPSPMAAFQTTTAVPTTITTTGGSTAIGGDINNANNPQNASASNVAGIGISGAATTNTRRSTDSSPSHSQTNHSQMSRNSSKKSNNSVNCKIDGKWKC